MAKKFEYKKEDDKKLIEEIADIDNTTKIVGAVMQYKDGEKKIQLARQIPGKEGWQFDKLGRIKKSEIKPIIKLLENLEKEL